MLKKPRYVNEDLCVGCGACAEKCPRRVEDLYNAGLAKRKAIYVEYAQAVPLKYAINPEYCIKLTKDKCGNCAKVCPANAIEYDQQPQTLNLNVGAVVLAPGFKAFDPSGFDNYQYMKFPNVVTSLEFERILSASGPTQGHVVRQSKDHREPKKIAWFQCVGSRDMNKCDNSYCSSVCCMYAIKEAVIAKEHSAEVEPSIFFMDMRTPGKDFERFYENAKKTGVRFVRSRVHTVNEIPETNDLEVRYVTESGELVTEVFDMIVLSVGLQTAPETVELANKLGIELTPGRFCKTSAFDPVTTSRDGIYVAGAFESPKDIPQSVVDASAAAAAVSEALTPARGSLIKQAEKITEKEVSADRPSIGVFVCDCGINIKGVVDCTAVAEYAKSLPYVTYTAENLYSCSQDAQDGMAQIIKEKGLNRVVVAACTPKTHEPLFQDTLISAGINKYLIEMCNIRNHNSWVHKDFPNEATDKAKDLVRMAVAKVALSAPLAEAELDVNQTALIVGGGIAGMTVAKSLANQGYKTHLVERSSQLGGQAVRLYQTPDGQNVQEKLAEMIESVKNTDNITLHLDSELAEVDGFVGNFKTTLSNNGPTIDHGVAIIATGGSPLYPMEYCYGDDDRILTSQELDQKIMADDPALKTAKTAVFIQCVGSREPDRPYCSRVCCTHSIDNALVLKEKNPEMSVYILYRDIRAYGERELLYKKARELGVIFIRYNLDNKPSVAIEDGKVRVRTTDHVLNMPLEIDADFLTLATAIVANKDDKLANFFKVPVSDDGFLIERHAKLGPVEFATDGVFLCGMAHYPKPVDESVASAKAAASRAVTLLAKRNIKTSGTIARVDQTMCSGCGVCAAICPYSAPKLDANGRFEGRANINPVLCKGCGLCVSSCRSGAIHLNGFDNDQIFAQIFSMNEAV